MTGWAGTRKAEAYCRSCGLRTHADEETSHIPMLLSADSNPIEYLGVFFLLGMYSRVVGAASKLIDVRLLWVERT